MWSADMDKICEVLEKERKSSPSELQFQTVQISSRIFGDSPAMARVPEEAVGVGATEYRNKKNKRLLQHKIAVIKSDASEKEKTAG
jgi:hypothetical protein